MSTILSVLFVSYLFVSALLLILIVSAVIRLGGLSNLTDYCNGMIKLLYPNDEDRTLTRNQFDWLLVGIVVGWPVLLVTAVYDKRKADK